MSLLHSGFLNASIQTSQWIQISRAHSRKVRENAEILRLRLLYLNHNEHEAWNTLSGLHSDLGTDTLNLRDLLANYSRMSQESKSSSNSLNVRSRGYSSVHVSDSQESLNEPVRDRSMSVRSSQLPVHIEAGRFKEDVSKGSSATPCLERGSLAGQSSRFFGEYSSPRKWLSTTLPHCFGCWWLDSVYSSMEIEEIRNILNPSFEMLTEKLSGEILSTDVRILSYL